MRRLKEVPAALLSYMCYLAHERFRQTAGPSWPELAHAVDPDSSDRLDTWMSECNPLDKFMQTALAAHPAGRMTASDVLREYKAWCTEELVDAGVVNSNRFSQRLKAVVVARFGEGAVLKDANQNRYRLRCAT